MKTVKNLILLTALLLSFPYSALMADAASTQGKVIINVLDENNKPYSGNWYLHQGITDNGLLVRNGSSGETFTVQEGIYFLTVYKKDYFRPYHVIYSTNPQTLTANETITFNVQYFKTEEEMANAEAPSVTETATEDTSTVSTPDTSSSDTGTVTTEDSEDSETTISDADTDEPETPQSPTYSRTYMGPRVTSRNLPTSETSAPTGSGSSASGISVNQAHQLAQTGSPAFLLFVFSGLLGGFAVRRKK